jgi:hypothetical protein
MGEYLRLETYTRISKIALDMERNKSEYGRPHSAGLAASRTVVTADGRENVGNFGHTGA